MGQRARLEAIALAALFAILCLSVTACFAGTVINRNQAKTLPGSNLLWYDIRGLDVEGRGWKDTEASYDRLPARAKGKVSLDIWSLGKESAGMCVRFVTDASSLSASWALANPNLSLPNMAVSGASSLDIYMKYEGHWRWLGLALAKTCPTNQVLIENELPPGKHEYCLYLPTYNGVKEVLIGLPAAATFETAPPYPTEKRKPIVFYGTSITQGACASRPGLAYPAILSRKFSRPMINLGFSGNGKMQPEVVAFLAELDPCLFFIDCMPNMETEILAERIRGLVRTLRKAHPKTPIVFVEEIPRVTALIFPDKAPDYQTRCQILRDVVKELGRKGLHDLYILSARDQIKNDGEGSVDGIHPNDVGMMRLTEAYEPMLQKLLKN